MVEPVEIRLDGKRIKVFESGGRGQRGAYGGPAGAKSETRFTAPAGTHLIGISLLRRTYADEGLGPSRLPPGNIVGIGNRHVRSVEVEGPHNPTGAGDTESRRRIFVCRPVGSDDELDCARVILSTLARRAFRRAVTADDIGELITFYESGRARGGFEVHREAGG